MTPKSRTTTGVLTMLVLLPVFAGLLACMPEMAPIGNPERARIDPELNDVWVYADDGDGPLIFFYEPWDKRTWILYCVELESDDEDLVPEDSLTSYDGLVAGLRARDSEGHGIVFGSEVSMYRAWTAKIGREHFQVWQIKGLFDADDGWGMNFAYNWRMTRPNPDEVLLQFMNYEHDSMEDVDLMDRKAVERVIRRHGDEDGFFDDEGVRLVRAKPEDLSVFDSVLSEVVSILD